MVEYPNLGREEALNLGPELAMLSREMTDGLSKGHPVKAQDCLMLDQTLDQALGP